MQTLLDAEIAKRYHSASQKIRILTETWVSSEAYCPNCGADLSRYKNNYPVGDFYCTKCREDYELKSKKDSIGTKIINGAYNTMLKRLQGANNPNLFLLNYELRYSEVLNFFVIPKHFFVSEIIEERKPLSSSAKRAGWVGCNILLKDIPSTGKIYYVKDKKIELRDKVLENWQKTLFLKDEKYTSSRGWILDIMNCIDKLGKKEFFLNEIYDFENHLRLKHPNNKHIKEKIRQQLQFLRDEGYLSFVSKGKYKLS